MCRQRLSPAVRLPLLLLHLSCFSLIFAQLVEAQHSVLDGARGSAGSGAVSKDKGITPFMIAVARSPLSKVLAMARLSGSSADRDGSYVHARDALGLCAMHYAAVFSAEKVGPLAKELGIDVNCRSLKGETPLMEASSRGLVASVRALLSHGAEVNARDARGLTALYRASQEGHREVVAALLDHGGDPNLSCIEGRAPLMAAAAFGDVPTVELLVSRGADVSSRDRRGWTVLHFAAHLGRVSMIDSLVSTFQVYVDSITTPRDGVTPLMLAASRGHPHAVRALALHGAAVNRPDSRTGETALHRAVKLNTTVAAAAVLLELDADPSIRNKRGQTSVMVHVAAAVSDAALLRRMLRNRDVRQGLNNRGDSSGWLAVHYAAMYRNLAALRQLVRDGGADINAFAASSNSITPSKRRRSGMTPLMVAVEHGATSREVRELVALGARVSLADGESQQSALHVAAHRNNTAAFEALVQLGGDTEKPDQFGITPRSVLKLSMAGKRLVAHDVTDSDEGADILDGRLEL